MKGLWCFPGGKHEFDERYSEATIREVKEETGYTIELIEENKPEYVTEFKSGDKRYVVISSSGFITGEWNKPIENINY